MGVYDKRPIKVKPFVYLVDQYYDCDSETMPLDDLQVRWGRSSMMDKPQSATANIRLFDKTNKWRDYVRNGGCIGKAVFLQAKINETEFGTAEQEWTWFRGRITDVSVEEGPHDPVTNRLIGYVVEVTAVDQAANLSDIVTKKDAGVLAANQTLLQRAVWLRNMSMPISGISEMFFDPARVGYWCSAKDIGGASMASLIDEFYASQGDVPCYSPKDNCIRNGQTFQGDVKLGLFRQSDGYIHMVPFENPRVGATGNDVDRYYGTSLSGCKVEDSGGEAARSSRNDINKIDINYFDRLANGQRTNVRLLPGWDTNGTRLWSMQSWLSEKVDVDIIGKRCSDMVLYPGGEATHPSLRYNTFTTGGNFQSVDQAMNLVMAGERQYLLCVTGSPWTTVTTRKPMFGVIGGTITLSKGQWVIDVQLQPYYRFVAPGETDSTWGQWPTSVDWGDASSDCLEPSITWKDVDHIDDHVIRVRTQEFPND